MIEVTKSSLDFDVPVKYYQSPDEADKDAGKTGALLEEGNNNLYYRGGGAQEAREIIAETVEKITGVKRATATVTRKVKAADGTETVETVKDKEGNPVVEYIDNEEKYVKGALAQVGATVQTLQKDITAAIRAANDGQGIRVDIRKKERKPAGPKSLPAEYASTAKLLFESGKVNVFAKEFKKTLGRDLTDEQKSSVEALGWAYREYKLAWKPDFLK